MSPTRALSLTLVALAALVGGAAYWLGGEGGGEDAGARPIELVQRPGARGAGDSSRPAPATGTEPMAADVRPAASDRLFDPATLLDDADDEQRDPPVRGVHLSGRVVDRNGNPIANAVVRHLPARRVRDLLELRAEDGTADIPWSALARTTTGDNGLFSMKVSELAVPPDAESPGDGAAPPARRFEVEDVPQLVVTHREHAVHAHVCRAYAGRDLDVGDVVLRLGASASGRVVDTDGWGVAGARVSVVPPAPAGSSDLTDAVHGRSDAAGSWPVVCGALDAETDRDGFFDLDGLWPGRHTLLVRRGGFLPARTEADLSVDDFADVGEIVLRPPGLLGGIVLDVYREPVPGARVLARPAGYRIGGLDDARVLAELAYEAAPPGLAESRGEAGAKGLFELETQGSSHYSVFVDADGYAAAVQRDVPDGKIDLLFHLVRQRSILVTLSDASGRPPTGLDATAMRKGGDELTVLYGKEALAVAGIAGEPDGMLLIGRVGEGETDLIVSARGSATTPVRIPPVPNAELNSARVTLPPEASVSGRVTRDGLLPLPGAEVTLVWRPTPAEQTGLPMLPAATARADRSGRYRVGGLRAGDWDLSVQRRGCLAPEPEVINVGTGQHRTGLDLNLGTGGAITGEVLWVDGTPAAFTSVRGSWDPKGSGAAPAEPGEAIASAMRAETQTDLDGRFVMIGLLPGAWILAADPGAEARTTTDVGATPHVTLQMRRPPVLIGRVLSGRDRVHGAEVLAFLAQDGRATSDRSDRWLMRRTTSDTEGIYRIEMPGDGKALVSGKHREAGTVPEVVELKWGQETLHDVDLSARRVDVHVMDLDTGASLEGVVVTIAPAGGRTATFQEELADSFGQTGVTDAEGRLAFEHLSAARYRVDAVSKEHLSMQRPVVDLVDGSPRGAVTLLMRRGLALTGRVRSADGGPLPPGVHVWVSSLRSRALDRSTAVAPDGTYRIGGLREGVTPVGAFRLIEDLQRGPQWVRLAYAWTRLEGEGENVEDLELPP